MPARHDGRLLAVSDLHVTYDENRAIVQELKPSSPGDWLLVAGDVADGLEDIRWALRLLAGRFERVVWTPGNHELWTPHGDPPELRGVARYEHLVAMCRELGVLTPEDPYPLWEGPGGPVRIVPLFLLYDYTFLPPGTSSKEEALEYARGTGVVCTDEYLLHPDPYPSREAWCAARVAETERRLAEAGDDVPLVFVNHYPLVREPTNVLWYPEFAQWCGTTATRDWHLRFPTAAMIYGHLHIPRVTWYDGVRFEEVSLGYPREWRRRPPRDLLRDVLASQDPPPAP
ncbi:metallophosphoesterase family protein [Nonomuraea wenchangensis]|uniref:3',5'-cyclic AMP phosphodiesterase CpdA n=1 Tax=Nonomuraea wenchangensis TaxID=568860 RepID=A0A1I0KYT1_9ACTN|nr:metallophosphoesterase [Nonomuraea wenchangensis]SEU31387.1 3',5'-cyclic AMP phosphodiesterase CpdA [Nonomuraea wenchangensis]